MLTTPTSSETVTLDKANEIATSINMWPYHKFLIVRKSIVVISQTTDHTKLWTLSILEGPHVFNPHIFPHSVWDLAGF